MAGRITDKNSQAQVYTSARFRRVSIHERHGLEAIVSFSAPYFIRKKSSAEQRDWWQRSPRLGEGTLRVNTRGSCSFKSPPRVHNGTVGTPIRARAVLFRIILIQASLSSLQHISKAT
ncbi:hypothetical protein LB505_009101 [Fusarium chuoi]|nr:hypothetical protein LB505_009101 [Fusarium chuoi]